MIADAALCRRVASYDKRDIVSSQNCKCPDLGSLHFPPSFPAFAHGADHLAARTNPTHHRGAQMNRFALYSAGALSALLAAGSAPANAAGCHLGAPGQELKHIVYIQFDNVHLRRDNPNVPSDLEQMPNLLHFMEQEGTLLTNHHTPLISHTSVDILTSLTGVYGEKMGIPIGNTILYFSGGSSKYTSSFAYWTDNLGTTSVPQMVDQRGKIHPAPWVPFTRAGCDVGAFSVANIEFENTTSDVDNVF